MIDLIEQQSVINVYITSIFAAESNKKWSSSLRIPKSEHYASDALIIVEFNLVESPSLDCNGIEVLQIASLQFNNLDVIGRWNFIFFLITSTIY